MLYLVTGATGLVGNNLVRLLLSRGASVRVLCRGSSDPRPLCGLEVHRAVGDIQDASSVDAACKGVDVVLHAAARVHIGWSGRELLQSVNVDGTRHVAAAAMFNAARLVYVSSVDTLAYGSKSQPGTEDQPGDSPVPCPYVLTKVAAEQVVLDHVARGLDAVIVNPVYMLGPWDWKPSSGRMLLEVARGKALFAPPGGNDFSDVRDVAAGILSAADRGQAGRRYILGGESLSYLDAWRMFAEVTGARPPLATAGRVMLGMAGLAGNLWARMSGHEGDLNTAATAMARLPHHFCCRRAELELGYSCRPAIEAARSAWEWFLEEGYSQPLKMRKPARV